VQEPFIIVIGGPNGVGKSTFAAWYLAGYPECVGIVDPDAIRRDLHHIPAAQRDIAAARIALDRIDTLISSRQSFAIETTLSGVTLAHRLKRAEQTGYTIVLCMLAVGSVALTMQRVLLRSLMGGHTIPIDDQLRLFNRSHRNFRTHYIEVCHEWTLYDAEQRPPKLIEQGNGGFTPR